MDILNYRKAVPADASAIMQVFRQSWSQFESILAPEHWAKMNGNMSDPVVLDQLMRTAATFVCDAGGELAGVVFLVSSGHPTPIYPADWAYIRLLSVHPAFRGLGIGRQLTEMCIELAKEEGEKTLGLHTSIMMPDARHIYSKLGFALVRELEPLLGQQYWLYVMHL